MKQKYITVVGNLPISFDLADALHLGPVIASANSNKSIVFPYATCNSEQNLQDMLNSPCFYKTDILVPEELFKKYLFFNNVNCLPNFPAIKTLDIEPSSCTPQILSLMLAVYLRQKVVFLLGYDMSNPLEMTRIKSIALENTDSRFVIISKEGKSLKLDGIKNFYQDNYFKYQEVIDKHGE
jgi:hypothetical protein